MTSKRSSFILFFLTLVLTVWVPVSATAAEWKIVRMSGDVRIFHENVSWVSLSANRQLKAGDAIWTGHNGRVMLSTEKVHVILKPRSMVKIPAQRLPGDHSVLFQSMGGVEANIDKRDKNHFSIFTPYLAAVVKGTRFSISIDDEKSLLRVREGFVQATDRQSGHSINVMAGQYVAILHGVVGRMIGNAQGAIPPGNVDGFIDLPVSSDDRVDSLAGGGTARGESGNDDDPIRCGGGNCGNGLGRGGGNGTGKEGHGGGGGRK